jgi:hypothetical protein
VGIQHLPVIIGLRRGAVNTGKWEDDYGGKMFLAMERTGNSLGFASSERLNFIEKNELPIYDGTQEYCLWLGCMGSYDPQGREIVLSLVQVLRHLRSGKSLGQRQFYFEAEHGAIDGCRAGSLRAPRIELPEFGRRQPAIFSCLQIVQKQHAVLRGIVQSRAAER